MRQDWIQNWPGVDWLTAQPDLPPAFATRSTKQPHPFPPASPVRA